MLQVIIHDVCVFLVNWLQVNLVPHSPPPPPTHTDVQYLQDVSAVGGLNHLNITCTFASSIDIPLQCKVDLFGPSTKTVMIPKVDSPTAVMMVRFEVVLVY